MRLDLKDARYLAATLSLENKSLLKKTEKREEQIKSIQQEVASLQVELNRSADKKIATKPTTKLSAYQNQLYGSLYDHDEDRSPPDQTSQQSHIEFTPMHKANNNVNLEEKKKKSCLDFQKRKKESMRQQKRDQARRQEEAAANPICLDDEDDEVKEIPKRWMLLNS